MNQVEVKRRQIQLCSLGLGLITIWILGRQIGDSGIAYLAAALEVYAFVWALISMQLPDTLGRMLRVRSAKGQYKNADKLKKCIFIFQGSLGILFALLCLAGGGFLAEELLRIPCSKFLIMLLAPVILLRTLNDVLLGMFQGEGSELPSAVSSVLRQLLILGFGLIFGKLLSGYGEKVSKLLGQEAFVSMYGGVGVVAGILLAEVLVLLFLLLIYRGSSRKRKNGGPDGMKTMDSFAGQIYSLYSGMPVLCGILELLPIWLGILLYQKNAAEVNTAADHYGVYFGKYIVVCGIVLILLAALLLPLAVKTAALFRKEDHRYAKGLLQNGIKTVLAYSLFFAVFTAVMAKQLAGALGDTYVDLFADMLTAGAGIILFGLLAFLCMTIWKLLGKRLLVLICLGAADILFLIVLLLGIHVWAAGIMALVYAGLVHAAVLSLGLCLLLLRQVRGRIDWIHTFVLPIGVACVSGLLCFLSGKLLTPHLGNVVTLLVTFVLAFLLHWVLLLLLRCYSEQEMETIPGRRILRGLGQLLGAL